MSPILNTLGGAIEKVYGCESCQLSKTTLENFVTLNFKTLSALEVRFIRDKFMEKKYFEGMYYKEQPVKKKTIVDKLLRKKLERVPVVTIRDYLCHLNYTKNETL